MTEISRTRSVLGFDITAELKYMGQDALVSIAGGCRAHIGSISTAYYDGGELKLNTLLLPEHRDDVVGDMFARALAERLGVSVTAVCGIHYDAPGKEGILEIVSCTRQLLDELLAALD